MKLVHFDGIDLHNYVLFDSSLNLSSLNLAHSSDAADKFIKDSFEAETKRMSLFNLLKLAYSLPNLKHQTHS